jgi:hypothetical protein
MSVLFESSPAGKPFPPGNLNFFPGEAGNFFPGEAGNDLNFFPGEAGNDFLIQGVNSARVISAPRSRFRGHETVFCTGRNANSAALRS